jgi:hypothetical protein
MAEIGEDLERRRLDNETARLELDKRRERREARARWIAPASVFLPLVGVIVTVAIGLHNENSQRESDFKLKAADLVLSSPTPDAGVAKAKGLEQLFPNELPADFDSHFTPQKLTSTSPDPAVVANVLTLLEDHPRQRAEIIRAWRNAFPRDTWLPRR